MVSDEEKVILFAVVVVIAVVVVYLELRIRKIGFGKKVSSSRIRKDQAFNALHTTKAVRNKLKIDRVDTIKADYMVERAEGAYEDRDYDSCINICKRAREELLKSKHSGNTLPEEPTAGSKAPYANAGQSETPRVPAAGVDSPALLQARFELKAARADLDTFSGDGGIRQRASQLIADAEKQFEARDYQKCLSASFRARKLMSGEEVDIKPAAKEPEKTEGPKEAAKPSENKCGSCGTLYEPDDIFCHSCGKSLRTVKCASCGADLKGYEKFCRKCGKLVQ